jgi:hypothetical protein
LIAGFAGAVRWMVKHYLYELRPNGGSSVKDKVDALETNVDLLTELVKSVETILILGLNYYPYDSRLCMMKKNAMTNETCNQSSVTCCYCCAPSSDSVVSEAQED